jgi:type II secretory pathway pseudopilin PulG
VEIQILSVNQFDMSFFTKEELVAVLIIFAVLITISVPNFSLSIKRSRDLERKDDMGSLQGALDGFFADFGEFPKSTPDGKIIGCKTPGSEIKKDSRGRFIVDFTACEWGKDSLVNPIDSSRPPYISPIPNDPQKDLGVKYFYISNGARYQLYGSLEDTKQGEYSQEILARGISCGARTCNFGRSFANTPLNISIEEYERTLQK